MLLFYSTGEYNAAVSRFLSTLENRLILHTNHAQAPAPQQYIARIYKYHAEIHFETRVPAPYEKHTQKREEMKIYVLR